MRGSSFHSADVLALATLRPIPTHLSGVVPALVAEDGRVAVLWHPCGPDHPNARAAAQRYRWRGWHVLHADHPPTP
jgi:hypothetical protein